MSQMDLAGLRMDLRILEKAVNELTRRVDVLERAQGPNAAFPAYTISLADMALESRPFMPTAEDFRALMSKDDDGA